MRRYLAADANADRVCLITGGGTGIGQATAVALAASGARIVICGRRPEPLAQTRRLVADNGGVCQTIVCDVRDSLQVAAMISAALDENGRIDVLVNNAGGQFTADAEQITLNGFRAVHRLVVDAAWDVTRSAAIRSMIPNRRGVVVFIGFSPAVNVGYSHASSARAAVANLASSLAVEWSRFGIRTVCVAVGSVATSGAADAYGRDEVASWGASVPIGRAGGADDVAQVIAFLASDAAAFITGSTVYVDGGQMAWGQAHPPPRMK